MNTEQAERWVMLEQAGELGPIGRWRLRRALARSPALQAWRAELALLQTRVREIAPAIPPTPRDVLAAIIETARDLPARRAGWSVNPAWSAAAASVLVVAAWMTLSPPGVPESTAPSTAPTGSATAALAWDDGLDQKLASLYVQLGTGTETVQEPAAAEEDLDRLASELLADEGVQI